MTEDFHVDMGGRLHKGTDVGIACVGASSKTHDGCVPKGSLIRLIVRKLCRKDLQKCYAKMYAICIYLLIRDRLFDIERLITCNDENIALVKAYLERLLENKHRFSIINITEFRESPGRNTKSFADNYSKRYRRRGLNKIRRQDGIELQMVELSFPLIQGYWLLLG